MVPPNLERPKPYAKRSLGQNFLTDRNYIEKIIKAVRPSAADTIVEIGPGRGAMTDMLVMSGAKIVAIELDRDLIPLLRDRFSKHDEFRLVEQDALTVDFLALSQAEGKKLKLVANLPYYISTAILQHLIDHRDAFSEMILMFQREVVERIIANPGNPDRGFLSVLVQAHLNADPLFDIPPTAFRPVPKVWSTVVNFTPSSASSETDRSFKSVVSEAFRQPRKTIVNNLKSRYPHVREALDNCNVDPNLRPEALTGDQWDCLCTNLTKAVSGELSQMRRQVK